MSLLCICMRPSLGVFYLPFYEFALSDESLLLCDNGQLHYHIHSKKNWANVLFLGDISSTVGINWPLFAEESL